MTPEELATHLEPHLPDVLVARGEVTVVCDARDLVTTLRSLRDDQRLAFDTLRDIAATDWPGRDPRFWIAYQLSSSRYQHQVRLKVGLAEANPAVATATAVHPTAEWPEREIFDLMGITFIDHPDLRRILLPDDWEGHPLRKTEALGGGSTRYHGAFIPPVDERLGNTR